MLASREDYLRHIKAGTPWIPQQHEEHPGVTVTNQQASAGEYLMAIVWCSAAAFWFSVGWRAMNWLIK